MRAGAI
jgi:hypothetical protein